ncbi:hypothetical protein CPB83DRAFT_906676 [Crepidotus variabilis]|uniref:Uncharacterized protein n=1 Tax=Crepidotus variabilis TaxID=179855 RepID=A0A9P6EGI1_9AGAR|nr:hypothetical protein CPB83DRAFT_906676 [Crepidotus variabilis]
MPFNVPSTIPQINYQSYVTPNVYSHPVAQPKYHQKVHHQPQSTCVSVRPPPQSLYDLATNRRLNDDFVSLKARIHAILQTGRLSNMPVGFPFHCAASGHHGKSSAGYTISYASYEFPEYIYLDSKSQPACAMISYTAASRSHHSTASRMMTWKVLATSRDAIHPREPPSQQTIAQVEIDPGMLETPYGIEFMTEPRILLQALRTSLEHSLHITIRLADSRTPDHYPAKKGLRYRPGDLIFVSMSNCGRSEIIAISNCMMEAMTQPIQTHPDNGDWSTATSFSKRQHSLQAAFSLASHAKGVARAQPQLHDPYEGLHLAIEDSEGGAALPDLLNHEPYDATLYAYD